MVKNKSLRSLFPEELETKFEDKNYTLDELALIFKTDKSSKYHNYTKYYEKYFEKYLNENINLLEVGVANGCSLKLWEKYFKKGIIFFF